MYVALTLLNTFPSSGVLEAQLLSQIAGKLITTHLPGGRQKLTVETPTLIDTRNCGRLTHTNEGWSLLAQPPLRRLVPA